MKEGILEADSRTIVRSMRSSIQGNPIRALVELLTNANDSYVRLTSEGMPHKGVIEILYTKGTTRCQFALRDHAEGMSLEEIEASFTKYGGATSGIKIGKRVRGFFGQGAKDALAAMKNGRVCTFKDGNYNEVRIFIEGGTARYRIEDTTTATTQLRSQHGIEINGTIAYFEVSSSETRVPRFNTVQEHITNNYQLRKILMSPQRKVLLIDENRSATRRRLRYAVPPGAMILEDEFGISYSDYGHFPIAIRLWRAERELSQSGEDRTGGLLLVDDTNVVLDISLYKYDNEPLASRFFGEVVIGRFRELLSNEEAVLSQQRDGLEYRHEFCGILREEIEKRIAKGVRKERLRRQREQQSKFDREEAGRYKKAFSMLNEIAKTEAQDVTNLGTEPTDDVQDPPDGFCVYPPRAQITVGKRYILELRVTRKVAQGIGVVKITSTHGGIQVLTPEIRFSVRDNAKVLRKYITVEGREPNISGTLSASSEFHSSQARLFVVPEKELLLIEGLDFHPQTMTLQPNKPRTVRLLVYTRIISGGSTVTISSDNGLVHVSQDKIVVCEADSVKRIAKYELQVWGDGDGQDATITAEYENFIALLEIRVRSRKQRDERGREGMFSEPEFDYLEDSPLQRTSYSAETGKVTVYVNFPSVRHYLGEDGQFKKTLPAQVLIADLVAEQCFYEIARKKVNSSGATLSPGAAPEKIRQEGFNLSRRYGEKLHEALVDHNLLVAARQLVDMQPAR